jgi:protein-disulfide isomerase
MKPNLKIAICFAAALAGSVPAGSAALESEQKLQFENIIRDYLLANPEILREMSERLQEKDRVAEEETRSEGLKLNAQTIFRSDIDPVSGNPKGDVTIVEFIDYNCGWCKKSVAEITNLVGTDKNVKLITKQFPIFGAGSEYAARAALAANIQGKYWDLHQALFKQDVQVTPEIVDSVAESVGINVQKMKLDIESDVIRLAIATNLELGKTLLIEGTPAFIVDQKIIPGYVPLATLQADIAAIRNQGGCKLC